MIPLMSVVVGITGLGLILPAGTIVPVVDVPESMMDEVIVTLVLLLVEEVEELTEVEVLEEELTEVEVLEEELTDAEELEEELTDDELALEEVCELELAELLEEVPHVPASVAFE